MFFEWQGDKLIISVRIQTRAANDGFAEILGEPPEERIKIRITAPPVEGKANQHLIGYLARTFKVAKSAVRILSGETGRNKRLIIKQPQRLPECIGNSPRQPATINKNRY